MKNIVFIIIAIIGLGAALAPIYPVQTTRQVESDYQITNTDTTGLSTSLNQITGVGTTTIEVEIQNQGPASGDFSATLSCSTSNSQTSLQDNTYIANGNTGQMTFSTSDQVEDCSNPEVKPPSETQVTETQSNLIAYLAN